MTSPFLRTLFLFWLCCYLAGPFVQMFDSWDSQLSESAGTYRDAVEFKNGLLSTAVI